MRSTQSGEPVGYLGIDPTSRYARRPRALTVCSLVSGGRGGWQACFWTWEWGAGEGLDIARLLPELRQARCVMIDGPQGLAAPGRRVRVSERLCRTAGKTPWRPPDAQAQPYGGFIRSCLELFAALHGAAMELSPASVVGGVNEFYPGEGWRRLAARRLPVKTSAVGRKVRQDLLARFGVRIAGRPSHDQLDACLGALLGAAADARVPGLGIVRLGAPLRVDRAGILREGPIVVPALQAPAPVERGK